MKNKSNNQKKSKNRRTFIRSAGLASAGIIFTSPEITIGGARTTGFVETLALEGGPKAVTASHDDSETWPRYDAEEERAVIEGTKV